jgi:uncharacterized protein YbjT (DUF2867 family)
MTRVLVTTALGNVGQHVVTECATLGLEVRAADLAAERVRRIFPAIEATSLDFLDRTTFAPALRGVKRVFLLRPPPLGDMKRTLCPFIDAAYAAGVEHVVFLSVLGAEKMRWVPHFTVEQHLVARGNDYTILRPGFFAQNLESAYRADIVEDARLYVPAGNGRIAFVDARDIGAVAARTMQRPADYRRTALTLTGPRSLTFEEVASLLSDVLGRRIRYEAASIPGYALHLRRARKLPFMQVLIQTLLHVGLRRGDAEHIDAAVERVLGRSARDLSEYVRDARQLFLEASP